MLKKSAPQLDKRFMSTIATKRLEAQFELAASALIGGLSNVATITCVLVLVPLMPGLGLPAIAAVAIGGAIGVVLAKSPVGSLLFMVTTLGAIAATFVLLEAHFLAAIQVIVYAGAIMVPESTNVVILDSISERARNDSLLEVANLVA